MHLAVVNRKANATGIANTERDFLRLTGFFMDVVSCAFLSPLWQDIEKTMTTALHELRELERQNTVKQAPDVVLDTLEPMKNPVSSEPGSPLHTIMIRDPDAAMRRSNSSTSEMMTTFKPALSARLAGAQLRPPPMRPVRPPSGQHRSSSSSSSGVGSPAVTPTEKMFPSNSTAAGSSMNTSSDTGDKSGTM